jgi:hypothetical protein
MKKALKLMVPAGIFFIASWIAPGRVAATAGVCGTVPTCPLTGTCNKAALCCLPGVGFLECTCSGGHYHCLN